MAHYFGIRFLFLSWAAVFACYRRVIHKTTPIRSRMNVEIELAVGGQRIPKTKGKMVKFQVTLHGDDLNLLSLFTPEPILPVFVQQLLNLI